MKFFYDVKTNLTLISILFSILLDFYNGSILFSISWIINILIIGNIKRLNGDSFICYFFRISGHFLHLSIFSLIGYYVFGYSPSKNYFFALLILVSSLLYYLFKNRMILRIKLSDISIANMTFHGPKYQYVLLIYNYLGAAICEELYFRYFLIQQFKQFDYIVIFLSGTYFFMFHYITLWGNVFKKMDYFNQLFLGIVFSTAYYLSNNIFITILAHIFFNAPQIYLMVKLYHRDYVNPSYYESLIHIDNTDDLLI